MRDDVKVLKSAGLCERLIIGEPELGVSVWIGPWSILDATGGSLVIGDYSTICTGALIYTHTTENRDMAGGEIFKGSVKIGRRCFVGSHAVIEPNVYIGDFCKIGANSFIRRGTVTGHNETWAGTPAVKVK